MKKRLGIIILILLLSLSILPVSVFAEEAILLEGNPVAAEQEEDPDAFSEQLLDPEESDQPAEESSLEEDAEPLYSEETEGNLFPDDETGIIIEEDAQDSEGIVELASADAEDNNDPEALSDADSYAPSYLFIGNSMTYYNNMPEMYYNIVKTAKGTSI